MTGSATADTTRRMESASTRPAGIRWGRLARRALYAFAILVVSYLLAVNVLLRTRLLRDAVSGSSVGFARERDSLSGVMYAPMVVAAAKGGTDGSTLDPRVVGSVAEALRIGGVSTLGEVPAVTPLAATGDPGAARGKVVTVTGRVSSVRADGRCSVGTLTTDAAPVYFVTPFAAPATADTGARFRGVFVQRCASADQPSREPPAMVLIGAFDP